MLSPEITQGFQCFVKRARLPSGNSYQAGLRCPVRKGSRDAEEDSKGCHKNEWMVWPRYRSLLPCRRHKTSLKLGKDHMAGQGNRVLNTYVFEARSDVDEMKGLAVCPLGLKRQSINDEASRSCYQHLVECFPDLITSLAPVFLMGGATKPVLHERRFPCTKGFRYHVRGSNCLSRSILANQPSS